MTEQSPSLAEVYQGWDGFQRNLIKAVAPLSEDQLHLRVAPTHWPIGMLLQHILNDRIWWFHEWMDEATPEVVALMHWEEEDAGLVLHSKAALVAGLGATWDMIDGVLRRYTVADLGHVFGQPPSLTERERRMFGPSTRQEILFHVLRHDIHHGGELAVGMGGYQLPTIWGSL